MPLPSIPPAVQAAYRKQPSNIDLLAMTGYLACVIAFFAGGVILHERSGPVTLTVAFIALMLTGAHAWLRGAQ